MNTVPLQTDRSAAADSPPAAQRPRFWRSLGELENDPEFLAAVQQEFAPGAEWWLDQPSRRAFLKRMGAAFALAGLTGCVRQPEEGIIPYVQVPEKVIPGIPQHYATALPHPGGAIGIVVQSHEGRPTKIEGNALHPESLGATDALTQASLLDLYDPHRSRVVRHQDRISNWADFQALLQPALDGLRTRQGAGLRILSGDVTSPTLLQQLRQLLDALPEARWHRYEPAVSAAMEAGAELAFGSRLTPRYQLAQADVIFSLDADFLGEGPSRVRLAREFASRRRVASSGQGTMNRLYVAEASPSITGARADHWQTLPPQALGPLLVAVARELGVPAAAEGASSLAGMALEAPGQLLSGLLSPRLEPAQWIKTLAADLSAARGRSCILVGGSQPAWVHALGHAINDHLGNLGATIALLPSALEAAGLEPGSLAELAADMRRGAVEMLLILDVDAVYNAPADLKFAEALSRVPLTIHHGLSIDATARACRWHLPATHALEEWSDARSADGTASVIQPLIQPLYDGRSRHEVIALLTGQLQSGREIVRSYWQEQFRDEPSLWEKSLHDGIVAGSAFEPAAASLRSELAGEIAQRITPPASDSTGMTVVFRPDPTLFDGRYSTNGWLQELPKPITKLVWGNACWISSSSAKSLGVQNGDLVTIRRDPHEEAENAAAIDLPVWVQPGQPDNVLTVFLGQGRAVDGFETHGVNVGPLRNSETMWQTSVSVTRTGGSAPLPATQLHHLMGGRDLIRAGTFAEFQAAPDHPAFMQVGHHGPAHTPPADDHDHDDRTHPPPSRHPPSLYPETLPQGPQWGMSVNLSACTGCNACVVACQSENNIPIVGADQVMRGREMHWLRIDSYFGGEPDAPEIHHQPVMCMHCEHAPCEVVCPVAATTHSDDGLNEMTYNRCIGTRYCSNNCPYKVRRFNFLDYRAETKEFPVLHLLQNPEVSVRSRGVMEKCTYCVQRIRTAGIQAKIAGRELTDGDVVTACQQVCPTQAIVFGNIADEQSEVARLRKHPLDYGLLTELNTRPRTSYLASVKNPHPDLATPDATQGGHG